MFIRCAKSGEKHSTVMADGEDSTRYIRTTTINDILGHAE